MSALYGGRGFSHGLDLSEALSINWGSASEPQARENQSRHKNQLSATEL